MKDLFLEGKMSESSIYNDIAKRTGGDIYIGVVGPVRTGKSTFIRQFLDCLVIPNIENGYDRDRTVDEVPMSAAGRTITTTEPKFVPDEAVKINADGTELNVKMIDCVGYVVDGALGGEENGAERLVMTPWSDAAMPFKKAAEIGTRKVISEHSTIAILVSTDGSFGEIARESFVDAEERVAAELCERGVPFAIVLNSARPHSDEAKALALSLEEKYGAPCALVDCTSLNADDIREILGLVLSRFPVKLLKFHLPLWLQCLPEGHTMREEILSIVREFADGVEKFGDIDKMLARRDDVVKSCASAGDGVAELSIPLSNEIYYKTVSDVAGFDIKNEKDVLSAMMRLGEVERDYRKIEGALRDVREKGYGIVMPSPEDVRLEEPKLAKQTGGFGVKVSASANTIHMINAEIRAELCPVVGTEEQTEEVVKFLMEEFRESPSRVWESNMFGKSLYDLVNDGMNAKLLNIPDESREKIGETLERIVNEGANGLICILL